ncbi:MAG: aminotransferase class I/II-fold pyridoxal phosphate-dependent enzyme [Planctomycetaceae bacterium]
MSASGPENHPARMGHVPPFVTEPSSPAIYQTTAFDVPDLDVLAAIYSGSAEGYIYTRDNNPNHTALGRSIAELEGAESANVFASGMGALAAVTLTLCEAGSHLIVARSLYGVTLKLMARLERQFGIRVDYVDVIDPNGITEVLTPETRMCLIETVSNPLLEVADISAIAAVLGDVPLVVDSTFTTPMLIRPLEHGATLVVHSASKYLNGHGDVMLGVVAGPGELMKRIRGTSSVFGQNANPFECWLTQRGLRTLPLRMQQVCRTAGQMAAWLQTRPEIAAVIHPSLPNHRTHRTASSLYPDGTGGIVSFVLKSGGRSAVNRFMKASPSIPFSPTLADSRTTISHPATTSHAFMTKTARAEIGITDELIRLSVGLEPAELLQHDLDIALKAAATV